MNIAKRLFLIITTSAVLFTYTTSFADLGDFYIKGEGGVSLLKAANILKRRKGDDNSLDINLKPNATPILGLGVGYYIMNNVRTDLTLSLLTKLRFNAKTDLKKDEKSKDDTFLLYMQTKGKVMSLLFNGYVEYCLGMIKIFAGGGVGTVQLQEEITGTIIKNDKEIRCTTVVNRETAYNFGYQLSTGASFYVSNKINIDLIYSWRDYGKTSSIQKANSNKDKNTAKLPTTKYRGHNVMVGLRFDI